MFHRVAAAVIAALLAGLVSLWLSLSGTKPAVPPPISGRNNTVLYLTDSSDAQSQIASASALLETHLDIQIYWGSFARPAIEPHLRNISSIAQAKNGNVKPIIFHEFGTESVNVTLSRKYRLHDYITDYGLAGYTHMLPILEDILMPWNTKEYFSFFEETVKLIEDVDPAFIVLDELPRPFIDAVRNKNRFFGILSSNALHGIIGYYQPWKSVFWKYPALMSGHEYPVPAHSVLPNIWMQIKFMASVTASPKMSTAKPELESMGISDPLNMYMAWENVPLISGDMLETSLPLDYYPANTTICGPMTLDPVPAEEQNPELVEWLDSGPSTMLVHLGDTFKYDRNRTNDMGVTIYRILQETDLQVLWKYEQEGDFRNTVFMLFLNSYIERGRLRVQSQLDVDPISLVNSGKIDVWVHHGAINYYHQAVRSGVRQIILPLWFDQYNVARTAEHFGVGLWADKETRPEWDAVTMVPDFLKVVQGETADVMQKNANELKDAVKRYSGRYCAAEQIARMAGMGH